MPGARCAPPHLLTDGTWGLKALDDCGKVLRTRLEGRGTDTATQGQATTAWNEVRTESFDAIELSLTGLWIRPV